jgi:hypothetical protein
MIKHNKTVVSSLELFGSIHPCGSLRTRQMLPSSILDHFREDLPTVRLHSILFSQQNWGYLPRSNLELDILIIIGCYKKMVHAYQYVVMAYFG